ncbi:ArnT family glycosyltransferase [Roseiflexus sp.]|uniref:ArnT family glycosyltransferase n=2 Tax=Roseiflexus sp. TaxID=2562120 RepID=UPI00398ACF32
MANSVGNRENLSAAPAGQHRAAEIASFTTRLLRAAGLFVLLLLAGLWNLEGPEFWWDEGWTLSVARTFVERGHYGRLLDGQLAPNGLEASPIVTLPIALSFQIFGVGLWQGRLVSLICAAAAVALIFLLAARAYNNTVAWGTVGVLLLLSAHPQLNALLIGRQVLGEMPMLLFLTGGYLCLDAALRNRVLWIVPASVLWSLALMAKAQTFPFWFVSLAGATVAALLLRRWHAAALAAGGAVLTFLVRPWVAQAVTLPIAGRTLPGTPVSGIYDVTAIVPNLSNRMFALEMILIGGIPTLLGLIYATWQILQDARAKRLPDRQQDTLIIRVALLGLAGSWFAWFAALSVGVPRYLFPAVFMSSPFTALLLHDLTRGFRPHFVIEQLVAPLRTQRPARQSAGVWLATLLVITTLPLTLLSYWRDFTADERAVFRVAAFLNTQTSPEALIETYESELHFLLDRRYHYPPDQVHVELNRRSLLGRETPVNYDPLAANPTHLVVGRFADGNKLYADIIMSSAFREIMRDGRYVVYERVNER